MGVIGLIMLFLRPTRGHGGRYRVNNAIRTPDKKTRLKYANNKFLKNGNSVRDFFLSVTHNRWLTIIKTRSIQDTTNGRHASPRADYMMVIKCKLSFIKDYCKSSVQANCCL